MEKLVAVIHVDEPNWPILVSIAGVALVMLAISAYADVRRPITENLCITVSMIGLALIIFGFVADAVLDSHLEWRQVAIIRNEFGYADVIIYDERAPSGGHEFTAKSNGQTINGRILVKDGTIAVFVRQ